MKVLLVGQAYGPGLGSEPGLTWNWAWHLSAHHRVWVLAHPKWRTEVEDALAATPNPNLCVIWVTLPPHIDPWDPRQGERWIRLHYLLWQRAAFREASRLHRRIGFDLVHHVSWNTLSAPPLLWRLPIPFVWGPVGGGQLAPVAFRRYFGRNWRLQAVRNARIRLLPRLPMLRRAVRNSALLLATNPETARVMDMAGARDVRFLYDNGLSAESLPASPPGRASSPEVTLLWAGRLEARKALPLLLEAMAQTQDLEPPPRLLVAGDGPLRAEWETMAGQLGLGDRVRFLGLVPWRQMPMLYRDADAFVFTSLQDSSGSAVFEAMAFALPVLTLNHQGMAALLPADVGVKVPVTTPAETVARLADGIRQLARSPDDRRSMGKAAWSCANAQSWVRRAELMTGWYREVVDAYRHH